MVTAHPLLASLSSPSRLELVVILNLLYIFNLQHLVVIPSPLPQRLAYFRTSRGVTDLVVLYPQIGLVKMAGAYVIVEIQHFVSNSVAVPALRLEILDPIIVSDKPGPCSGGLVGKTVNLRFGVDLLGRVKVGGGGLVFLRLFQGVSFLELLSQRRFVIVSTVQRDHHHVTEWIFVLLEEMVAAVDGMSLPARPTQLVDAVVVGGVVFRLIPGPFVEVCRLGFHFVIEVHRAHLGVHIADVQIGVNPIPFAGLIPFGCLFFAGTDHVLFVFVLAPLQLVVVV